jgi:hypothetical protein
MRDRIVRLARCVGGVGFLALLAIDVAAQTAASGPDLYTTLASATNIEFASCADLISADPQPPKSGVAR